VLFRSVRRFPQVAEVPRDELRQRLAADAKQLHAFGITVDSLVRRMLEWTALLGASFWCVPRYGWVGGALAHPEMGEREKVALIDGRLTLEAAGHRAES